MTLTHAEFVRLLPADVRAASIVTGRLVAGGSDARRWELELSPERSRSIGAIRLTVVDVEIRLWGHSGEERDRFVAHLERHFQRAGG